MILAVFPILMIQFYDPCWILPNSAILWFCKVSAPQEFGVYTGKKVSNQEAKCNAGSY